MKIDEKLTVHEYVESLHKKIKDQTNQLERLELWMQEILKEIKNCLEKKQ